MNPGRIVWVRPFAHRLSDGYAPVVTTPPTFQHASNQPPPYYNENWSSGICDCCSGEDANCCTCCLASCCHGIAQGVLMRKMGVVSSAIPVALGLTLSEAATGNMLNLMCFAGFRNGVAEKLGRKESMCESFCISCCCFPCAVAQMERDTVNRTRGYKFVPPESDFYADISTALGYLPGRIEQRNSMTRQ